MFNPQLICKNWSQPHIEALETVLDEGETLIEGRLNLNSIIEAQNIVPSMHICQNVEAEEDVTNQIVPFIKRLSPEYHLGNKVKIDFYQNEKGHNGMVDNEKTIDLILRDLRA